MVLILIRFNRDPSQDVMLLFTCCVPSVIRSGYDGIVVVGCERAVNNA
jgi:hypothetical protein